MNFEGQNISLVDALFVDNITGDLEAWRVKSDHIARVLVFPPVNNYHRFLVHKVVETGFPEFTTFSVGEGVDRRTVVCFQQQLLDFTLGNHTFQQAEVEEGQLVGQLLEPVKYEEMPPKCVDNRLNASSAPFIPGSVLSYSVEPSANKRVEGPDEIFVDCRELTEEKIGGHGVNLTPTKTAPARCRGRSKRPERAVYVPPRGRGQPNHSYENGYESDQSVQVNHSLVKANVSLNSMEDTDVSTEDTDSDSIDPNDVTDQVVKEITAAVGGVQIESPTVDYLEFRTSDSTINIDQFGHVIELYDFPQQWKTNDLMAAFQAFTSKWDIKWVDDTHALGVFSSVDVAAEALALRNPHLKSRPLNMATAQSKCKARAVCDFLLPYKQRPLTSTAPARRLLQWALGSDKKVPAASKAEQDRLRDAMKKKDEDRRKRREEERQLRYSEHDLR